MTADLANLTSRLDDLLSAANQRLTEQIRQSEVEARQQQERHQLYNQLAENILTTEIVPRLKELTDRFPNGKVELINVPGTYGAIGKFQHTVRFPATVELTLNCSHDDHIQNFLCTYDVEILPLFIEFMKHDKFACPLIPVNRHALGHWLEDKIVQFLETYLQLEFVDQYQRENWVTDPVTQTRINRAFAAGTATYKRQTYYFLSSENQKRFEAEPELYVTP